VTFRIVQPDRASERVDVPVDDAARLRGDLATFADDDSMRRSREIAQVITAAMEHGHAVQLTGDEIEDVFVALDRIAEPDGLSQPLIALRGACARPG
jgi:hypothetical protein